MAGRVVQTRKSFKAAWQLKYLSQNVHKIVSSLYMENKICNECLIIKNLKEKTAFDTE